jgi:hypothetical protein
VQTACVNGTVGVYSYAARAIIMIPVFVPELQAFQILHSFW